MFVPLDDGTIANRLEQSALGNAHRILSFVSGDNYLACGFGQQLETHALLSFVTCYSESGEVVVIVVCKIANIFNTVGDSGSRMSSALQLATRGTSHHSTDHQIRILFHFVLVYLRRGMDRIP